MLSRTLILATVCAVATISSASAFAPHAAPSGVFASGRYVSTSATSLNLFGAKKSTPTSSAANSPAADDAVAVFTRKYGSRRKAKPIDESKLRSAYAELARLFSEESASKMAKAEPCVLEFRQSYFEEIKVIFDEKFGEEATQGLLIRNPGLLGIKPDGWGEEGYGGAATAGPETIALSYVIAATRPLGNFGLVGLLALVLTPGIDAATGLGLRDAFLGALGVK